MSLIARQAQAVSSLSKPSQRARDNALQLAVDAPWEDYLSPAPMCIAILGQLQLVATKRDFSIRDSAPTGGFQHIKYPDSFRACLVQVTNNGWRAFNTAHTKMNQVKLLSGGMPDKIETIFKILVVGSIEEVQQVLPLVLSSVSRDAQQCETLAKAVDAEFLAVMELTSELLEVCTNQKGLSEQKLQQAESTLAANKILTEQLAKQEKEQAERVKDLKEASKKAEELFNETVKKMPSGWDIIGMNIVESLGKTVTNAVGNLVNLSIPAMIGKLTNGKSGGSSGGPQGGQQGGQQGNQVPAAIDKALDVADQLLGAVTALAALDPRTGNLKDAKPDAPGADPQAATKGPAYIVTILADTIRTLTTLNPQSDVAKDEIDIANKATAVANRLQKVATQLNKEDVEIQKITAEAQALLDRQQAYGILARVSRSRDLAPTSTPGQYQTVANNQGLSAGEQAQKNWQMAMEATQQAVKETNQRYDAQTKSLQELQMRHAELMAEMAKIDVQKINFVDIIEVLKQGITALAELRVQWQSLCRFFSNLAAIIETCNGQIKYLTAMADEYANMRLSNGSSLAALGRDLIYNLCVQSDAVARVVTMISGSYVDVSTKYIMTPLAQLSKIAALDAGKDADAIRKLQQDLLANMTASHAAIVDDVVEQKKGFKREIEARAKQVDQALGSLLPPAPADIKQQVQQAQQTLKDDRKQIEQQKEQTLIDAGLENFF
ncbi:hypothetical protein AMAG_08452 [Allomyces macrogynus ATCC 38327]|uniref:Uncharacterized protein n=1 Tax=Allomyces macrogynus (strain ATCC 38327) TaxID=578462 RepID=A0A0L0SLI9_ALLM3|nr:hypothetical protein AMAG_08452 [Allomyces macrogynus ATCC 38327]|eukprot:KNE63313.1 hypothetical protein AMAG_08452 [Allomyces macrogynus ATCC 38327]